jgi:hypothetical protein
MIIQRNNLRRLYEQPVLVFALEIFYTLYSTVVFTFGFIQLDSYPSIRGKVRGANEGYEPLNVFAGYFNFLTDF